MIKWILIFMMTLFSALQLSRFLWDYCGVYTSRHTPFVVSFVFSELSLCFFMDFMCSLIELLLARVSAHTHITCHNTHISFVSYLKHFFTHNLKLMTLLSASTMSEKNANYFFFENFDFTFLQNLWRNYADEQTTPKKKKNSL